MPESPGKALSELRKVYAEARPAIESRLADFELLWREGSERDLFCELAFCLMTPQSKARSCWATVECLLDKDLLLDGPAPSLAREMNRVRFRNNKSRYIAVVRPMFITNGRIEVRKWYGRFSSAFDARQWLVDNVKGMGYKEASHFLRNIGVGGELAILDRHILKNLVRLGVISEVPRHISPRVYLDIERRMEEFSRRSKIPMASLDLLLWYREAGEVFK